ncbi:unnamed protein product, partial [Dracunculus medinensis]|uniref:Tropomodulin n=1 Tax=Dracunculus medinensis TaxID=318479 RepID=A0A0N4UQ80_DRAME
PIRNFCSYYTEEKSISAPSKKPINRSGISGLKLYGKDIRDLDDTDLEVLLSKLSPEELEDLNCDFDPDNSLLPPSQRCRNQTDKAPTGPFQREKLLSYLEETAKKEQDWEEYVPFSPGVKRGKVFQPKKGENAEKADGEMEMPIELDVDDDDELDEALNDAPEKDLVDLAGILGMHNLLNQPQYYNALKGKSQDESTGTTFRGVVRSFEPKIIPEEPENTTDIEDCIRQVFFSANYQLHFSKLESNEKNLTEININNMKRISKERIKALIRAACGNKQIRKLSMANTAISDQEARGLVELLETSPSLRVLNIESNFISPELLAKLLRATLVTQNLRASVLGNQIEMDMMLSVEENESLLRVGVSFQSMEARHRVSEALERNYERRQSQSFLF